MNKRFGRKAKDSFSQNVNAIYIIIVLITIGLISQMVRWQLIHGQELKIQAQEQYTQQINQKLGRGTISTENGTILAIDEPRWNVYASLSSDPRERKIFFDHKEKYIAEVSGILEIPKKEVEKKLDKDFRFVLLKRGVTTDKKELLASANIFGKNAPRGLGLYFQKEEERVYPNNTLAAHIIGFIGKDWKGEEIGRYGIEGFYNEDLSGVKSYSYEEKDSKGNIILTAEYTPITADNTKNVVLTIKPNIQKKVEDQLKAGVIKHQAKSGSAIVMEVKTGKILAMANYPTYNPNEYWKTPENWIYKNKAIADVYEYGSVEKPITEAIALETKSVTPNWICHDKTGKIKIYDKTIYTWDKNPDGDLDLAGVLINSNNPCAVRLALATPFREYYEKLKEFGIGQFIGLGLQDEATSYLPPYEEWTKVDLAVSAFGQGISATPLQIMNAINTIANKGKRVRPYIVSEIQGKNKTIKIKPQILSTPISEKTAEIVIKNMQAMVNEGESRKYFHKELPQYSIAGKTGTAQIPKKNAAGYEENKTNVTFIGFAPAEDPQIIMIVRLEQPKTSTYSASTAVPTWINIFKAIADDLEIPKNNS